MCVCLSHRDNFISFKVLSKTMNRLDKYKAKIDGNVISKRYEETKELAVRKQSKYFKDAVAVQNRIKAAITGVSSMYFHYYMDYGEELVKNHTQAEWEITYEKWRARGLVPLILSNLSV